MLAGTLVNALIAVRGAGFSSGGAAGPPATFPLHQVRHCQWDPSGSGGHGLVTISSLSAGGR